MSSWSNAIGVLGAVISIYAYARVQWRRDYAKSLSYSVINLAGTFMLLISLYYDWNLAAFLSNSAWGLISIYGIYRCAKYWWRDRQAEHSVRKRNALDVMPVEPED